MYEFKIWFYFYHLEIAIMPRDIHGQDDIDEVSKVSTANVQNCWADLTTVEVLLD